MLAEGESRIADICRLLQDNVEVASLWDEFQRFAQQLRQSKLDRMTLACELHTAVSLEKLVPSIHFHLMFDSRQTVTLPKPSLLFRGAVPHQSVECKQARGKACRKAYDQGHYYLQVPKIGSIHMTTTAPAFTTFPIAPDWITNLWQACKITEQVAEKEYLRCKKHVKAYFDNMKFHAQCMQTEAVAARKAQALLDLQPLMKTAVVLEQVQRDFLPQFARPMFRRSFLVLTGPTRLGKTIYARSLFGHRQTLELNCCGVSQPDLRGFNPLVHRAILYDEGSADMVLRNRRLFQGSTEEVTLAHSGTNLFTYSVYVYNVAMILTSNSWLRELEELQSEEREWLEGNSICIDCKQPLYET
ncbi:unnamed protein product [Symbiodinium natans]|uniref:Uncharacterized protein n=1 Tax=Symbiodinium natans TaxID=878477 RepID=A0A812T7U5_9DINO|nr:unnamed protein product [Symbiodinium natans]